MQHPELPVFAFLTALLVLVPLPWHWRARNVATVSISLWLFLVDVVYGINSIIWAGNVNIVAPVWCDIATKIVVGASYALPLGTLCICKHLEMVSSSRKVRYDGADRQRRIIFESVMCFAVPCAFMVLHYVVQGHRFDIFENTGCQAALYISIPAVFIVWFPQLLFSLITLIYAVLALHHFVRRRLTFAAHLKNCNSALTTNRYLRLIAMAVTEMVWGTTLTTYNLYNNVSPGLRPWTTWADVHSNFSRIDLFPSITIPPQFLRSMMLFWWSMPVSSFIFFLFFGFGDEALKEYGKIWNWFKTKVLRRKPGNASPYTSSLNKGISRPLHLVEMKQSKDMKRLDSTVLTESSSFSFSSTSPTKAQEAENEQSAISSLSYYAQSIDTMHESPKSHTLEIPVPEPYTPSAPITPLTPSTPLTLSDSATVVQPQTGRERSPSPVSERPFGPPSVYPVWSLRPDAQHGIVLTIQRQASVDQMV